MELFYLIFIIAYVLIFGAIKKHWERCSSNLPPREDNFKIALLIPFRNESRHLPPLLMNLEKHIPASLEVIFIDDDSRDDSYSLIAAFLHTTNKKWKLLKNSGIGKKSALTTGILNVEAEIIMTTDADCILPEDWHRKMSQPFHHDQVQLVAGPVMTVSDVGFFSKFQQIEWAGILLVTQYFFSKKKPLMCSGANFAYRKSAFMEVGGYTGNERHLSGDDEFLLKKVISKFGSRSATYLNQKDVLVKTHPAPDLAAFLQQRVRWAGKWKLHQSPMHVTTALGSMVVALVQLGSFFLIFGEVWSQIVFLIFWTLKIRVEKKVLGEVLGAYDIKPSLFSYIKTSFLHPVYLATVGLVALRGKFTWKGRKSSYKV